ncbi:MAG TPA: sulfurtransferase TusA family protein [Chloroflexota bacterium]|jgi:TusA-related sulfurtransferase
MQQGVDELLAVPVTRRLDLRGETCPTTSAETLRVLEDMTAGEVLEVASDYEPARTTIPYHCGKRGYRHAFVPDDKGGNRTSRAVWRIRIQRT